MFKDLCVPKLDECKQLILDFHKEIGHFGEGCTLVEVNKWYLWHNKTEDVRTIVCARKQC